jgi:predicted transposase YdaD
MELVYHYTQGFSNDLSQLSEATKDEMAVNMNKYGQLLLTNPPKFYQHVDQPYPIQLINGYESSLYSLPIGTPLSVIATVDEDPIFDQLIVTLMRAVKADQVMQAYSCVADSLYQDWLIKPAINL